MLWYVLHYSIVYAEQQYGPIGASADTVDASRLLWS